MQLVSQGVGSRCCDQYRLKAADEVGTKWMTDVCNAVVKDGTILDVEKELVGERLQG